MPLRLHLDYLTNHLEPYLKCLEDWLSSILFLLSIPNSHNNRNVEMTKDDAFTIVTINHPDDLRAPETRYAVNSYTHRHHGRRPKQISLKKPLAISWTKSKENISDEPRACSSRVSSETEHSEGHPPAGSNTRNDTLIRSLSPLTIEFSGLRRDPFTSYPIPVQGCVEGAVDFWLQEWVPSQVPGMVTSFPS